MDIGAEPIVIGSREGATLMLTDAHVSGRHAQIEISSDGVILSDLGSRNGTQVDGVPIHSALLEHGARITIGNTAIRFESDTGDPIEVGGDGPNQFGEAVAESRSMRQVFALLERIAPTNLTICILGETGTGKDVLARATHQASPRASGPFVVLDCGGVAPSLIESELFGHVKGSFTGAVTDRAGVFERGHRGTVFLDEIGELTLDLQPKLLRVIEQGKVRRVGDSQDIDIDVRVIAATNRDLEQEVAAKQFRQDLFFRLSAAVVRLPPLRDRREDLPKLVELFMRAVRPELAVSPEAMSILCAHDWPGNVRELRNVIAGAAAVCETGELCPQDFILFRRRKREPTIERLPLAGRSLEEIEKSAIRQTLAHVAGNKTRAAEALGIAPSTLYAKIKKYGL